MIPIARPIIGESEKNKIMEVLESGILASGAYVEEFEKAFAAYTGTAHGIAASNGTTALHLALMAAGIKEGDKVLTTPFTFIASSNAILYCGAIPVFADVERDTFNIDPEDIHRKLEEDPDIRGLLIVHLYGCPCKMDEIMELVEEYDLILIEDCAQAHGAEYRGRKIGTFGKAAAYSFYPTKNMTTSEGGMVLTDDEEVAEKARLLVNHGSKVRYYHEELGYNYRMTNLEAAIGLGQLEKLEEFNRKRQENAAFLSEGLKGLPWLELPHVPADCKHVFHQYTVKVEERDKFVSYLQEKGIGYGIHYPLPVYRQPIYKRLGYGGISLPVTEELIEKVVSLPVHPALTREDLETIVQVVRDFSPEK